MRMKIESIQNVFDRAMDQMAEVRKAFIPDLAPREVGTITSVGTGISTCTRAMKSSAPAGSWMLLSAAPCWGA